MMLRTDVDTYVRDWRIARTGRFLTLRCNGRNKVEGQSLLGLAAGMVIGRGYLLFLTLDHA